MDTNLLIALIIAPLLFVAIAWIVLYSRRKHQEHLWKTTIKSYESQDKDRAP